MIRSPWRRQHVSSPLPPTIQQRFEFDFASDSWLVCLFRTALAVKPRRERAMKHLQIKGFRRVAASTVSHRKFEEMNQTITLFSSTASRRLCLRQTFFVLWVCLVDDEPLAAVAPLNDLRFY